MEQLTFASQDLRMKERNSGGAETWTGNDCFCHAACAINSPEAQHLFEEV
jgi:hypothetical protein